MFGYAINMDVRNLDAAVADMSGTSASRQMVMDLEHTQIIKIIAQVSDADELEHLLRQGKISVGIFIPPDFDRRMQQADRSAMQLLVDGSDTVVQGAAAQLARYRSNPGHPPTTTGLRRWNYALSTTRNGAHRLILYRA